MPEEIEVDTGKFNFEQIDAACILRVREQGGYMNAATVTLMKPQGTHVSVLVDLDNMAVKLVPKSEGGKNTYKIFGENGFMIPLRKRVLESGLERGTYIHVGENIFQHARFIE